MDKRYLNLNSVCKDRDVSGHISRSVNRCFAPVFLFSKVENCLMRENEMAINRDDIINKVFSRSALGYDDSEVDEFLDEIMIDIENNQQRFAEIEQDNERLKVVLNRVNEDAARMMASRQEINQLREENARLVREISDLKIRFNETESDGRNRILADRKANEIILEAQNRSDEILRHAENQRAELLRRTEQESVHTLQDAQNKANQMARDVQRREQQIMDRAQQRARSILQAAQQRSISAIEAATAKQNIHQDTYKPENRMERTNIIPQPQQSITYSSSRSETNDADSSYTQLTHVPVSEQPVPMNPQHVQMQPLSATQQHKGNLSGLDYDAVYQENTHGEENEADKDDWPGWLDQ